MSSISIYKNEELVSEHDVVGAEVALGRHPDNDIVLEDLTLSRFHARLESRERGYVVVELPNQNGIFVNGSRINGEQELSPGDRIRMGCYVAIFDAATKRVRREIDADDFSFEADQTADVGLTGSVDLDFSSEESNTLASLTGTRTVEKGDRARRAFVMTYQGHEVSRHVVASDLVIGRSKTSDIVISLLGLSRKHVNVRVAKNGIFVKDLGSQNGTWVNNQRIDGERCLVDGDVMNFYEYALIFLEDGSADIPAEKSSSAVQLPTGTAHSPLEDDSSQEREVSIDAVLGDDLPSSELADAGYFENGFDPPKDVPPSAEILKDGLSFDEDSVDIDQTTFSGRPPQAPAAARVWLTSDDEHRALAAGQREGIASVEIFLDDQTYTQFILSNPVTRIGSDPRCELALPPEAGVAPWHCTLATIGASTLCFRQSGAPFVERDGLQVNAAVLESGDEIVLGRIRIVHTVR